MSIAAPPSGAVYQVGEPIWFTGTFTDPGVLDTHTATWSFDGVDQAGSVTESGGSGTTGLLTSFSAPGVYSVRLTVADDDGSTLIRGEVADQAALHGLIQKVRDLGLPLLSVSHRPT